jgi:hypothetical protein
MACPATGQVETENRLPQIARHIGGMGACRAPSGPKRPHLNFTGCLASMHSPLDTIEFATKSAGTHRTAGSKSAANTAAGRKA